MTSKLDDFEVLDLIGSGSFGSCYKVRNKYTHEILVWKVIEYGCLSEEKKQLLVTEVSLLRDLRHPNIVSYFDRIVCKETKQLYILIEYCPGGDLATVIKTCIRNNTLVEERFVWQVLQQLSCALQACHSWLSTTVILHRDIKPANVFLDDSGNVKLGDFGLACRLDASQPGCIETMVGTPFYMSPEVMKGEMYNSKSDVWSLGCLVYELCALKPPFQAQNIKELAFKVSRGRFERIPSYFSESLQKVLNSLLLVIQEHRPSIFELVRNPVILSHISSESDPISSSKFPRRSLHLPTVITKAPPPSPAERQPEKVSKDTFQSEWLARLQSLRDREAALRHRELQLEEKEHTLTRREHRLALMERSVRDKMVLAEVYLKRSRENRTSQSGPARQTRPHEWKEVDESFSADAGDTSVMPTSALLDPTLLPKPSSFHPKPDTSARLPDRRVHFDNQNDQTATPHISSKPSFLKIAEAIRTNKAKINPDPKPRMQKKVLHLPGYTGPAITVDVPVSENYDVASNLDNLDNALLSDKQFGSPSVKLTVLYDDREELQKATYGIDALNLETEYHLQNPKHHPGTFQNMGIDSSQPMQMLRPVSFQKNVYDSRNIAASVDSLLDAKLPQDVRRITMCAEDLRRESSSHNDLALRKNAFGGSSRRRRKSTCRSSTPMSSECKTSTEQCQENIENAKNNALLLYHKDTRIKSESAFSKRQTVLSDKGKENFPSNEVPHGKKSVATSLLAMPSVAAASAVVSRSKKSQVSYLR